ncbi:putative nuclease HARBI1 [Eurosta solidaginis]|uniref:putative nuclease HARBI1 n=1 Tax=Eurosta solidaginis TaxID=178769 RepID=UPI0035317724
MDEHLFEFMYESSSESANTSGLTEEFMNLSGSTSENEEEHVPNENFLDTIDGYTDQDFRKHFKMNRSTAHILIERYNTSALYSKKEHGRFCKVGAAKEIYMLLWYMASTSTFREIANRFNMAESTAWRVIRRVIEWLLSIGHEYVQWPSLSKARDNIRKFYAMKSISNVIGCIDCSHIKIKAPVSNKEAYFNRKHFYSLQLQAVVDADKIFIDIFAGEPGSLHDSRVLRRSSLYQRALDDMTSTFPFNSGLLGDSAYANTEWLISPFRDNGFLTSAQRQFNYLHSSTRNVVENAFGLLKMRFRRLLHFTEHTDLQSIVRIIICGCILHNICCFEHDSIEDENLI